MPSQSIGPMHFTQGLNHETLPDRFLCDRGLAATIAVDEQWSGLVQPTGRCRGMPGRFLLQVLRNLVVHGVLRSDLGVDGGYTLNRPLDSISLLEVIEAIEGPIAASVPTTLSLPAESYIRLRTALDHVARLKRAALQNVSLACLLPDYLDKVS